MVLRGVLLLCLSGSLATAAHGVNVSLIASDDIGTTSFNTSLNWSNGQAPSAGNDYITGDYRLRTPPDGGSYTFGGDSLTIDNTNGYPWGMMYKGTGNTGTITINNLILAGGMISHASSASDHFQLEGNIDVISDSQIHARQGPIHVGATISGTATLTNPGSDGPGRTLFVESPFNTFTGNIVNDGRLHLAAGAVMNFVIGAAGVNNSISGVGAETILDGEFTIDLTGAGTIPGDSWTLVSATATYGPTFSIRGFTQIRPGTWDGPGYWYDTSTGVLYCGEPPALTRQMEALDRGVVAVYLGGNQVYVGWRMLGTEPQSVGYNLYRRNVKLNPEPITGSTNYLDTLGTTRSTYSVAAVIDGVEQERSTPVVPWDNYYHDIALQRPAGGTTPDQVDYDYSPNDASVGDLDGDGQYEIVLKWDPSNSKDNAQSGFTGNVYLDAYEIDGTFLWRIDLGINIRAGAHYTQFMVYDLDSDGRSEIVCKTADGTTDAAGTILGDPAADYRNGSGRILAGPEYLSVFDGQTGTFIDTVDYIPLRGNVSDWGDSSGNRVDRFLAGVAYLDGRHPSVVMCRGYYTRTVLAAWDLIDEQLSLRWVFDSDDPGNGAYAGQGNHSLSVADVDSDGFDEIVYGSCTIDHDGTGLYSTGLGHGDALHVSDMDPNRPGLEVWACHETSASGTTFRDAATGAIIWEHDNAGDIGRCLAAHIDADAVGYQLWSVATNGTYTVDSTLMSDYSLGQSFVVWWTADRQRESLDAADGQGKNPKLDKWNGVSDSVSRLLSIYNVPTPYSTCSNNYTKANPCLSGDILGDWREEMIFRSSDNTKLRIFTTTAVTDQRIYTLMHDSQYRVAMAWQNVGYNQPPHPSFYIGAGMSEPPTPNIILVAPCDSADVGDQDCDGDVDLDDFTAFALCLDGPMQAVDTDCVIADLDGDGDADLQDFSILQIRLTAN
jgi:rhamnogalacturonan endolyase